MSSGDETEPRYPGWQNPFEDPALVQGYEAWYDGPGKRADRLEKRLLGWLLRRLPAGTHVLEVGCGTGHFTRWLRKRGFAPVGLDRSTLMLAEAERRDGIRYVVGDAMALPFDEGEFDVAAFITSLEFVPDPDRAIDEALRVARRGLLIGGLNGRSRLAAQLRLTGQPPWTRAHFFSPNELASKVRVQAGERLMRLTWRTTLWPLPGVGALPLPWGGFTGLFAELHPHPRNDNRS